MNRLLSLVWNRLRTEPVAVWGVVLAAAVTVMASLGVPAATLDTITVVLTLLGIPVVRSKVTPMAALQALVNTPATPAPAAVPAKDAGDIDLPLLLLIMILFGVGLLLFGIHFH